MRYFTDICGIGQGFRYAPWRKEFPYAYALFFAFSEVEIKTAQLIHTASQLYNFIAIFSNAHEAMRQTEINHSKISACCRKERNKTGGYKWMLKSDWETIQNEIQLS